MKSIIFSIALVASSGLAADWVVVEGGVSPDKKLAVAVLPQQGAALDEADGSVLLIDAQKQKRIGTLEEVTSNGGTWGKTTENVRCAWSPDGKILLVNFRIGRLMNDCQIYRISNRRAIPLSLPADTAHPKGKIFEVLTTTNNPGSEVAFSKNGELIKRSYGFKPKEGHFNEDYSRYGLKGFDGGTLCFFYKLKKDWSIELTDIALDAEN
ncbi:MAG: hypothetical protein WAW39_19215 [Prosthecobacter sp.]|uniref:hypothetical protein n=1 Tax=Prosthecobacter sp. TaxID=1965333 RepID=UPI003BAFABA5